MNLVTKQRKIFATCVFTIWTNAIFRHEVKWPALATPMFPQRDASSLDSLLHTPLTRAMAKAVNRLRDEQQRNDFNRDGNRQLEDLEDLLQNPCESELMEYMYSQMAAIGDWELVYDIFVTKFGSLLPTYAVLFLSEGPAALVETDPKTEFFGLEGAHTDTIRQISIDIAGFWADSNPNFERFVATADKDGSDEDNVIRVKGIHGTVLEDSTVRVRLCQMLGLATSCTRFASELDTQIQSIPNQYDNLLFTLNAMALDTEAVYEQLGLDLPPAIVVGDGLLDLLEQAPVETALGVDYVVAHEFVHMAQMEWFIDESPMTFAEASGRSMYSLRKFELMADAFAAYFLGHELGGVYSLEEIEGVSVHAQAIGDAEEFDSHGIAGQRECAVIWGALESQKHANEDLLSFYDLKSLYDTVFDKILEGDSAVCPDIDGILDCQIPRTDDDDPNTNDSGGNRRFNAGGVPWWTAGVAMLATVFSSIA